MGVILVTGASRGIGRGIALELARAGYPVAVHYNGNREAARATADECTALARAFAGAPGQADDLPHGASPAARAKPSAAADAIPSAARDLSNPTAPGPAPAAGIFQADISIAEDRRRLVDEVTASYGSIDGLVNNAGIAPRKRDDIVFAEEDVFDEVMRVNLYGPYFLTQLVARRWLESASAAAASHGTGNATPDAAGAAPADQPAPNADKPPATDSAPAEAPPATPDPGLAAGANRPAPAAAVPPTRRIVFVTSVSAVMVSTSRGEYCVSKAGLSMAASLFAARLAPEGVLVYEVRPGITQTDMTAAVTEKYDRLIAEGLVPQGRWGFPEDTGKVVRSILDGNLDFSAGSVIYTDGGLTIPRL